LDFARNPSPRRMGAGSTICPLLDTVVCTSYIFLQ
jgi:hypothetical protein